MIWKTIKLIALLIQKAGVIITAAQEAWSEIRDFFDDDDPED